MNTTHYKVSTVFSIESLTMTMKHYIEAIDLFIDGTTTEEKEFNRQLHGICEKDFIRTHRHLLKIDEQWQAIKKEALIENPEERFVTIEKATGFKRALAKINLEPLYNKYISKGDGWKEAFQQIVDLCDLIKYAKDKEIKTEQMQIDKSKLTTIPNNITEK
eukprot:42422_1